MRCLTTDPQKGSRFLRLKECVTGAKTACPEPAEGAVLQLTYQTPAGTPTGETLTIWRFPDGSDYLEETWMCLEPDGINRLGNVLRYTLSRKIDE